MFEIIMVLSIPLGIPLILWVPLHQDGTIRK